jgi:hypothetical protein
MEVAGHVTRLGYTRGGTGFWQGGEPRERGHLEEPNIDGNYNIKPDLEEVEWEHGLD